MFSGVVLRRRGRRCVCGALPRVLLCCWMPCCGLHWWGGGQGLYMSERSIYFLPGCTPGWSVGGPVGMGETLHPRVKGRGSGDAATGLVGEEEGGSRCVIWHAP